MSSHALYRFYAANGGLLYVGISLNPGARWQRHREDKPWWSEVSMVTVDHHPTREAALEAEKTAIILEQPRYNIIHNAQPPGQPSGLALSPPWGQAAEDMPDDCHDWCAKHADLLSMYFPYYWDRGRAYYRCMFGHEWTCGWGHNESGRAPENRGRRQKAREELNEREIRRIKAVLATPGHYGPVL